eukprot:scaffold59884_cov23-Phaeocystis_antarctica.AAC.1
MSRGRAPRPRAAASGAAPASPTCMPIMRLPTRIALRLSMVTTGSDPMPSPWSSRCIAALSPMHSTSRARRCEPSRCCTAALGELMHCCAFASLAR